MDNKTTWSENNVTGMFEKFRVKIEPKDTNHVYSNVPTIYSSPVWLIVNSKSEISLVVKKMPIK